METHDIEALVASPLRAYRGWRLSVGCRRCGTYKNIEISDLDDRYREGVTIRDIVERLTCRKCGGTPTSIELRHHVAHRWILNPDV